MTGTIRRVVRPRGDLTPEQTRRLETARKRLDDSTDAYRREVVAVLGEGGSFNAVHNATGLSNDTLQRWKRAAAAEADDTA